MSKAAPAPVRKRANLSSSPLSRPESLIHMTAARMQEYLYFPAPEPLYVLLGTIVANMMDGNPVWVMLVGAPSSGRTILLETLAGLMPDRNLKVQNPLARVHIVGAIKGPGALLSGTGSKEKAVGATGGLLKQIGGRGMLVMKDFTSMLSLPHEALSESMGALREIYDGRYSRPLGTEGGRVLEWKGKIGFIGAVTPAIDRKHSQTSDLGERWIYYRYPETDGYGESMKSLNNRAPDTMMTELRALVLNFVESLDLTWAGETRRELDSEEANRMFAIAAIMVRARSMVPRDGFTKEVIDIAHREAPARLTSALGQLYLGLERIGLEAGERWKIIGKMAFDSAPQIRTRILQLLYSGQGVTGYKTGFLREHVKCSARAIAMTVEDMRIHGLVERVVEDEKKTGAGASKKLRGWDTMGETEQMMNLNLRLTPWAMEQMRLGWKGAESPQWKKGAGD